VISDKALIECEFHLLIFHGSYNNSSNLPMRRRIAKVPSPTVEQILSYNLTDVRITKSNTGLQQKGADELPTSYKLHEYPSLGTKHKP